MQEIFEWGGGLKSLTLKGKKSSYKIPDFALIRLIILPLAMPRKLGVECSPISVVFKSGISKKIYVMNFKIEKSRKFSASSR